jgi:hypothetical protein
LIQTVNLIAGIPAQISPVILKLLLDKLQQQDEEKKILNNSPRVHSVPFFDINGQLLYDSAATNVGASALHFAVRRQEIQGESSPGRHTSRQVTSEASLEKVKTLCEHPYFGKLIDINVRDSQNRTALFEAVATASYDREGATEISLYLLDRYKDQIEFDHLGRVDTGENNVLIPGRMFAEIMKLTSVVEAIDKIVANRSK